MTNEFTDVQRGYGTWLYSHGEQAAALGLYFMTAWPPDLLLSPGLRGRERRQTKNDYRFMKDRKGVHTP